MERGKQRVTIYLDTWVVEMFKAKAGERGYQTLINEALVQYLQQADTPTMLRVSCGRNCGRPPRVRRRNDGGEDTAPRRRRSVVYPSHADCLT